MKNNKTPKNPVTAQFIEFIKIPGFPHFITENQISSGRWLLTVLPTIEAEKVASYRLEFPADDKHLKECPYPFLMFVALFDKDTFIKLRRRVSQAVKSGHPFEQRLSDWRFKMFKERDYWIIEIEAPQKSVK